MTKLPPKVAEAFRLAAITALQELAQVETLSDDCISGSESDLMVIATLQLLRESPGNLSLALSEIVAAALATRYLPTGTAITAEMANDVAGEFANVIAGQAKTMLKGTPYHFQLTTPVVIRAKSPNACKTSKPGLAIQIATDLGAIQLLVDLV